ncbi:MAG: sigma-70 family RNA polymerase sigma factor [Bacteroidota bacterium]
MPAHTTHSERLADWSAGVRDGDAAAFEALFHALHAPLVRFGTHLGLGLADADDLAQEAFVRLWENRATVDPSRSVRAWLYRTLRNLALNQFRDQRRHDVRRAALVPPDSTPPPDDVVEGYALARRLEALVEALPERQREALLLTRVDGLAHVEVAAVMGISARTVNNHLVRALRALREGLDAGMIS